MAGSLHSDEARLDLETKSLDGAVELFVKKYASRGQYMDYTIISGDKKTYELAILLCFTTIVGIAFVWIPAIAWLRIYRCWEEQRKDLWEMGCYEFNQQLESKKEGELLDLFVYRILEFRLTDQRYQDSVRKESNILYVARVIELSLFWCLPLNFYEYSFLMAYE